MRTLTPSHRLTTFFCSFMMVFLVALPKGGIKLGPVPLTWGYMFIAVTAAPLFLVRLLSLPLKFTAGQLVALAAPFPFLLLYLYAYLFYGFDNVAQALACAAGLFVLPIIFLFIYPPFLPLVDGARLARYLRWCIFFAAIWGLILFFQHPITNSYLEIPYVTVNVSDYGELENTKHIARGLFFKLISTYNNGNLYGVCTLLLLPLYDHFERSKWRRGVVKLAVLFTLSRTVWLGLIVNELLPVIVQLFRQIKTFPVVRLGKAGKSLVAVAVVIAAVFASLLFNGWSAAFLFDSTAGGRTQKLVSLSDVTLLPSLPLYGFEETLYVSALKYWGVAGLIAFCLFMFSPLLVVLVDRSALQSPTRRAALKGLVVYMIVSASDGGVGYIPVMAFYWFIYMIFLFGWPAARSRISAVSSRSLNPSRSSDTLPGSGPVAI